MWSWKFKSAALFFVLSVALFVAPQASADQREWQIYDGGNSEEVLTLRLGRNRASIIVGSERCVGDFWGAVSHQSDHISLIDPIPVSRSGAPECEFKLWPLADGGYRIEQGSGCTSYHGAMCDLSGVVSPVTAPSALESVRPIASFECSAATNLAETSICNDPALSKLDRLLALVYQTTLSLSDLGDLSLEKTVIVNDQRLWLAERNNCADDNTCLSETYYGRLTNLTELWIDQQYDPIWLALSQEPSLEAVTDTSERTILVSQVDDSFEHIFVFDPDGRLAYRSFDAPYDACSDEFSYGAELAPGETALTKTVLCGRYGEVRVDTVHLTPECIELVSLYHSPPGEPSQRRWRPLSGPICAEDTMLIDRAAVWDWGVDWEDELQLNDQSSGPAVNLMDASRHFINYWESSSIQLVDQSELPADACPADELTLSYVKLINFYHNLPFSGDEEVEFSEPIEYWFSGFGYTFRTTPIDGRFSSIVDDYTRFEGIAEPLLVMTLRALNHDGAILAVIHDLLAAYDNVENPSQTDQNTFFPCENFKLVNGPLYEITYWRGFDTYGFWQRRRVDGTAPFVFHTLVSLRDAIGD